MMDQDSYEVDLSGTTRQELWDKALELASKYFEVEPDKLEVLPFTAEPAIRIESGDGGYRYLPTVNARVSVVVYAPTLCEFCGNKDGWHFGSCPKLPKEPTPL